MDEVRPDYGINEDDAMEIPNFSLMERFLVIGGKDPNLFYKNIMKVIYPANRKKSSDVITTLKKEMELRKQINEGIEDSVGIFGLFKEIQTEKIDAIGNWFEKTEANCGAINLPRTSVQLYAVMKSRHLNFFESIIQANIRKEAESIHLAAFEFWNEKEVKKAFEDELNKFLYNNPNSEIEGYDKGIVTLMIAMIRLKKEIDLMPMHQRKQDFVDRKLVNLRKLPIEDQREQLISEQEDILISLNLIDEYIMSFIKKDVETEDFVIETRFYRSRKNVIRTYKALQILVERKFEIFMNLILFRNVIAKFWTGEMNNEVVTMLIRAGMVCTNIRVWKDFILARDSGLVPVGIVTHRTKSSKPITEANEYSISAKKVMKKDSEGIIQETELGNTSTNPDLGTIKASMINKEVISSEAKKQDKETVQQAIQSQEVIEINSESETEIQEPKEVVDILWKQREPKRSNKYIPEDPDIKMKLANEGWLSKRYPSDGLNIPNAIEPFRKEMSSTDAWPFERGNERCATSLSTDDVHMTKHSSFSIKSSESILSPISVASTVQQYSGKELRPRIVQDTLSKY